MTDDDFIQETGKLFCERILIFEDTHEVRMTIQKLSYELPDGRLVTIKIEDVKND